MRYRIDGHMVDQKHRARLAWPYLVRRATTEKVPFTYGELGAEFGLHARAVQWFLGEIQEYCAAKGWPALQALVVNKRTRLPGLGYKGLPRTTQAHKAELKRVRGMKWPPEAPF
jgi:hypothetical protein